MTPFSGRDRTDDIWAVGYAWADIRYASKPVVITHCDLRPLCPVNRQRG